MQSLTFFHTKCLSQNKRFKLNNYSKASQRYLKFCFFVLAFIGVDLRPHKLIVYVNSLNQDYGPPITPMNANNKKSKFCLLSPF